MVERYFERFLRQLKTMKNTLKCGHCAKDVKYEIKKLGQHMKATCPDCGKFIKFIEHTPKEKYLMPFGKYKGQKLIDIVNEDQQYFEWVLSVSKTKSLCRRIKEIIKN